MIELQATCQTLKTCCHDTLVSDSLNAIKLHFVFSDEWDGMKKTAQFTQRNAQTEEFVTYNVLLDEDEGAELPNEITDGTVIVSVFGVDGIRRLTTNAVALPVIKSGFKGDGQTPIPPTPDLYQQLIAEVNKALAGGGSGGFYTLPTATGDTLGGVKVGSGLSITADGTLSATGGGGGTGADGTGIVSINIVEV